MHCVYRTTHTTKNNKKQSQQWAACFVLVETINKAFIPHCTLYSLWSLGRIKESRGGGFNCIALKGSWCKMRLPDLPEPAATRQQNSYTCYSSAPYSSSITLIYARRLSLKLTHCIHVLQHHAKPWCWHKPVLHILAWRVINNGPK
jgi:hypothetical protein